MKEVHFIVQGKGGVGKSLTSMILAQYLKAKAANDTVYCFDTDPVNKTFSRFKALSPEMVKILTENNTINTRVFDGLMEKIINEKGIGVVDNGAATFVPLMSYLAENHVDALFKEENIRLLLHVPVSGGQDLRDCLSGLKQTAEGIDAEMVVWLNEYKGEIKAPDGKGFTELPVYQEHKSKIIGMINLGRRNADTYGKDIEEMVSNSLTFDEAIQSFGIMERQRLKTVKRELYEQLDKIPFSVTQTEPVKTAKSTVQEA